MRVIVPMWRRVWPAGGRGRKKRTATERVGTGEELAEEQRQRAEERREATGRLRRHKKWLMVAASLATVAAVAAIVLMVVADTRRRESERLRLISIAQALATQAQRAPDKQDERGVLFARQAYLFNQRSKGHVSIRSMVQYG